MKSMSYHRSRVWTARGIASLGVFALIAAPVWSADQTSAGTTAAAQTAGASSSTPARVTAAATPSVNAPAQSATAGVSNTSSSASSEAAAQGAPGSAAQGAGTRPAVICFQSSIQCFSARTRASASSAAAAALDLRAPELRQVFSQAELQQTLPDPDEQIAVQETVQVEAERQVAPVSVGLMAIPWAIMHPTQAWRILMPLPEAK